jgi:hypothetical protein
MFQVLVTQQQFYDIALAQLEELWSFAPDTYFEVWFDGGLPTDPYFQVRPFKRAAASGCASFCVHV